MDSYVGRLVSSCLFHDRHDHVVSPRPSHQHESSEHEQSHEQQGSGEHELPRLFGGPRPISFPPMGVFVCPRRCGVSQEDAEHPRPVRDGERMPLVHAVAMRRDGRAPSWRSIRHVSQRLLLAWIHLLLSAAVQRHQLRFPPHESASARRLGRPRTRLASQAHLLLLDVRFAHWTRTRVRTVLHPSVQARPAVQVSARRDHGMVGHVQADVAFEPTKQCGRRVRQRLVARRGRCGWTIRRDGHGRHRRSVPSLSQRESHPEQTRNPNPSKPKGEREGTKGHPPFRVGVWDSGIDHPTIPSHTSEARRGEVRGEEIRLVERRG